MKTCLLLGIVAALVSAARGACDACVDGRCLRKQPLPGYRGYIVDVNRNTNVFYVAGFKYSITQCNSTTLTCNDTAVPLFPGYLTVDQRTGDLYAASPVHPGVYKLDILENKSDLLIDKRIETMMFKDKLYYTLLRYIHPGIYTYDGGIQQIVPGTENYAVCELVVDKNDDIYFRSCNRDTIWQLKNGTGTANSFCERYSHLSTDKDGNAMVFDRTSRAVYRVINDELVEVGAVTGEGDRLVFDGDNNIICVADFLKYNYLKHATDEHCSTVRSDTEEIQIISKPIITTTAETVVSTFTSTTPAHETSNTPDDNNNSNTN